MKTTPSGLSEIVNRIPVQAAGTFVQWFDEANAYAEAIAICTLEADSTPTFFTTLRPDLSLPRSRLR